MSRNRSKETKTEVKSEEAVTVVEKKGHKIRNILIGTALAGGAALVAVAKKLSNSDENVETEVPEEETTETVLDDTESVETETNCVTDENSSEA